MLQDNIANPRSAHVAHASVLGLHVLCCGAPLAAMAAASVSGIGAAAFLPSSFVALHDFLHGHELWVLALSAALLAVGAGLELRARWRRRALGFPVLLGVSALCFVANLALIAAHRLNVI